MSDEVWGATVRDMNELAAKVRLERKRRHWTQAELAEKAGVYLGTVSNFERRKANPTGPNVRAILRALDIEAESENAKESQTSSGWPPDVKVFLDFMGIYLTALTDEKRESVMHDLTHQIIGGRH